MRDCRLLDFPGATVYSANLPGQPALAVASDMGTGALCIVDAVLRLGRAYAAGALARQATPVRASCAAQCRNTSASVWAGRAVAHLVVAKRQRLDECMVQLGSAAAAAVGHAFCV